jgi:hypothetical protein
MVQCQGPTCRALGPHGRSEMEATLKYETRSVPMPDTLRDELTGHHGTCFGS